jgi:transposase
VLSLVIYGYATKVFSSRAIERATYDPVAFRYIAANKHPEHDTIANFRKLQGSMANKKVGNWICP